jgi:hypothetical protein
VGLNDTSTETKINPKVINNNPHHRSNHDADSFEALIPNILQIPLSILTEERDCSCLFSLTYLKPPGAPYLDFEM